MQHESVFKLWTTDFCSKWTVFEQNSGKKKSENETKTARQSNEYGVCSSHLIIIIISLQSTDRFRISLLITISCARPRRMNLCDDSTITLPTIHRRNCINNDDQTPSYLIPIKSGNELSVYNQIDTTQLTINSMEWHAESRDENREKETIHRPPNIRWMTVNWNSKKRNEQID